MERQFQQPWETSINTHHQSLIMQVEQSSPAVIGYSLTHKVGSGEETAGSQTHHLILYELIRALRQEVQ